MHRESTATYDPELAMCTESIRITLERNRIAQAKATTYKIINTLSLHNKTKRNMNQLQTGIYLHEKHMIKRKKNSLLVILFCIELLQEDA